MVVAAVMEVPSDGSGKEPCEGSVGCWVVWLSGWCGFVVVPGAELDLDPTRFRTGSSVTSQ
jgi:hypothetical protein